MAKKKAVTIVTLEADNPKRKERSCHNQSWISQR